MRPSFSPSAIKSFQTVGLPVNGAAFPRPESEYLPLVKTIREQHHDYPFVLTIRPCGSEGLQELVLSIPKEWDEERAQEEAEHFHSRVKMLRVFCDGWFGYTRFLEQGKKE